MEYFPTIDTIQFSGPESDNPFSYRYYNPSEKILGKSMEEHLRMSVCFWHTYCWNGADIFGDGTFGRPWLVRSDVEGQKQKADAAFEMISKLGLPYYCFHDVDIIPPTDSPADYVSHMEAMVGYLEEKMANTGVRLLWGTANLFSHPRYLHGAATSPDPEVFAWGAHQVFHAMNATKRLNGANYVLWGGREGYETLLNTDLKRERAQLGRFMQMVVDHKHKIGFKGELLIEPKPHEPTKHQYDYDVAAVHSFLQEFGLVKEMKVNLEVNHGTLAGHSFHHEVATSIALGIFGSIDANRGDPQLGWDTDQFPNSVHDFTLPMYEIVRSGGFTSGGFNFDARLRRASVDPEDLFHAHIGGVDTLALSLKKAAELIESKALSSFVTERYEGWDSNLGRAAVATDASLEMLSRHVVNNNVRPLGRSGRQERLERQLMRIVNRG